MKQLSLAILMIILFLSSCNPMIEEGLYEKDLKKDVELNTDYGPIVLRLSDKTPLHRNNFIKLVKQGFFDSLSFYRVINHFVVQTGEDTDSSWPKLIDAEFRADLFHKRGALNAAREGDIMNPGQGTANLHFTIIHGKVYTDSTLDQAENRINRWKAYNTVINKPEHADLLKALQDYSSDTTWIDSLSSIRNYFDEQTEEELKEMDLYRIPPEHREVYKTLGGAAHLDQNYTVFGEVVEGMNIVDSIAKTKTDKGDKPLEDILIREAKLIRAK